MAALNIRCDINIPVPRDEVAEKPYKSNRKQIDYSETTAGIRMQRYYANTDQFLTVSLGAVWVLQIARLIVLWLSA